MTISLHKRVRRLLLCVLAGILCAAVVVSAHVSRADGPAGEENAQRLSFLSACGWEAAPEPVSVRDVEIPAVFSDVYERYNALNEEAGFSLTRLAGKTCRQYVYRVTNGGGEAPVFATLLVYRGEIVGGDVSSAAMDGFMEPLRRQG